MLAFPYLFIIGLTKLQLCNKGSYLGSPLQEKSVMKGKDAGASDSKGSECKLQVRVVREGGGHRGQEEVGRERQASDYS